MAIVSLCAYLGVRSINVTQAKLLQRIRRTTGRVMSRRTLNRHLRAWCARGVLNRITRHIRDRATGAMRFRATNFSLGLRGIMWIKTQRDLARFPLGRLRVPKMAQSQKKLSLSGVRGRGGQVVHRKGDRAPAARGTSGPRQSSTRRGRARA